MVAPGRPTLPAPGPTVTNKKQRICGVTSSCRSRSGPLSCWRGHPLAILCMMLFSLTEAKPTHLGVDPVVAHPHFGAWYDSCVAPGEPPECGIDRHDTWQCLGSRACHPAGTCQGSDCVGSLPDHARRILSLPPPPTSEVVSESVHLGAWGSKLRSVGRGVCAFFSGLGSAEDAPPPLTSPQPP